ncbi:MAG TPA: gamma-glutamylcyclotransferase family protein [Acidimicrobiia bacterium]|nr:gamma-glutamylcyclotransferase family protein [Acidimicrobiia bacterium]
MPDINLYFAYGSMLDPDRISDAAPGSRFLFTAHFPETRLDFVHSGNGPVPTLIKEGGHTVWGGVFEIPGDQVASLTAAEREEGRVPGFDVKAVDREGNKYDCLTFVAVDPPNGQLRPSPEYLAAMVKGARHWKLPAGWVLGLEDLAEDPLFS